MKSVHLFQRIVHYNRRCRFEWGTLTVAKLFVGFAILGISGLAQLENHLDQLTDSKIDSNLDLGPATAIKINFTIAEAASTTATLDN